MGLGWMMRMNKQSTRGGTLHKSDRAFPFLFCRVSVAALTSPDPGWGWGEGVGGCRVRVGWFLTHPIEFSPLPLLKPGRPLLP